MLESKELLFTHFMDKETEAKKVKGFAQRCTKTKPGLEPGFFSSLTYVRILEFLASLKTQTYITRMCFHFNPRFGDLWLLQTTCGR